MAKYTGSAMEAAIADNKKIRSLKLNERTIGFIDNLPQEALITDLWEDESGFEIRYLIPGESCRSFK